MDRIIEVKGNGGYLSVDKRKAGNQHEANSTKLRITFDPGWDGYAKTVTFWDAKGQNPVKRTLTADLLENVDENTRVYLCPIPGEALAENGMMTFTIDGYVNGVRQRTVGAELEVTKSPYEENAGEATDPTPSQAEQLQVQIEGLLGDVHEHTVRAETAAEAADQARIAAERARDASLEIAGGEHVTMKDLEGKANLVHASRHKRGGADPLVAADIGALSENLPYASDLLTVTKNTAVRTDGKTLNTPYKAGVTSYASGVCIVGYSSADYSTLLYISTGYREAFLQANTNGVRSGWTKLATTDIAVNKAGDTMPGNLRIKKANFPGLWIEQTTANREAVVEIMSSGSVAITTREFENNNDKVVLTLNTEDATAAELLQLRKTVGGTATSYNVIHTGNANLITPAAIGAAKIETGTYVGTGKAGSGHPNSLTFGFEPTVVMLGGYGVPNGVVFFRGMKETTVYANTFSQNIGVSFGGNTISWHNLNAGESSELTTYTMGQLNMLGETYTYVALG